MKQTTQLTLAAVLGFPATSLAAGGTGQDGGGLWALMFLGFFAIVIALQLIPGLVLLGSGLRALFSRTPESADSVSR